jgi:hypothetical protein
VTVGTVTVPSFEGGAMEVTRNEKGQSYTVNSNATSADNLSFTDDIATDITGITTMSADEAKQLLQGVDNTGAAVTSVTVGGVALKTFSGQVVANTDGQVLYAAGTPRFPAGALFALHDDKAVAAFDLRDVAHALALSERCMQ